MFKGSRSDHRIWKVADFNTDALIASAVGISFSAGIFNNTEKPSRISFKGRA